MILIAVALEKGAVIGFLSSAPLKEFFIERAQFQDCLSHMWNQLMKFPVTLAAAAMQAPALALIYPLDTFKTRLQIPFGNLYPVPS